MSQANNVSEAIPFLRVRSMDAAIRFYTHGLGFAVENRWEPDGHLRWCLLRLGGAKIMLQDFRTDDGEDLAPPSAPGEGFTICLMCHDAIAIFRQATARGLVPAEEPFVGNGLWVAAFVDPDGHRIAFESPTDVAEDTKLGAA